MDRRELSGAVVGAAVSVANILVGFAFQAVLAAQLGTGTLADVFSSGVTVATILATAIMAAGVSVLVPALEARRQGGPHGLQRRDVTRMLGLAAGVSLLVAAASPFLATILEPASIDATSDLAIFIAITSIVPVLAFVSVIGQADCLVRREYRRAASVGLSNGIGLFATTLALVSFDALSSVGLALAVVAGYVAQVAWMAPPQRRALRALPRQAAAGTDAVRSLAQLSATSALFKSQPFIERVIAAGLVAGTTAALGYANKVTAALVFAATLGLQAVALPRIAELVHRGDTAEAVRHLARTLQFTWWLIVMVLGFTIFSAQELVFALFGRGEFTAAMAESTATLVLGSLGFVLFGALTGPVVNVLYAARARHSVTVLALSSTALGGVAAWWLSTLWGPIGVTLGTSVGMALGMVGFGVRACMLLASWRWLPVGWPLVSMVIALALALLCGAAASALVPIPLEGSASWVDLCLVGVRFAIVALPVGVWVVLAWQPARNAARERVEAWRA